MPKGAIIVLDMLKGTINESLCRKADGLKIIKDQRQQGCTKEKEGDYI